MKVLHINTAQTGGAAWCAIRINKALQLEGVDSRMLFSGGAVLPEGVKGAIAEKDKNFWFSNRLTTKIKHLLNRMPWYWDKEKADGYLNKAKSQIKGEAKPYTHHPFSNFKNIAYHPLIEWADIIHLHWVSDFVDYPTFFKRVKKPIVWTLHDKYPAVGIMHYSSEFFPIPIELQEIDNRCRQIKRKGVKKARSLNIVAIAEEVVDICKKSEVLFDFPITLIHNGVNTNIFRPFDKQTARIDLGLPSDTKILLFSGFIINDRNKGLNRLIDALNKVKITNKMLVCLGKFDNRLIPTTNYPIHMAGLQNDQTILAKYYSAADFYLQCSYEETFAQTPLEAMACGTPIISTPCCGAKDLIRDFNGVICTSYDAEALSAGIAEALNKKYQTDLIRQHIVDNYQYDKIAKQYINLYECILNC